MLPRNIDLTEHGDFGSDEIFLDETLGIWFGDELLTPKQYDAVRRWETIFGKRVHRDERSNIFTNVDLPFLTGDNGRCTRCGRRLVPWNHFYGFCMKCNDEMERFTPKIPWRNNTPRIVRAGDRGQGDLFELR